MFFLVARANQEEKKRTLHKILEAFTTDKFLWLEVHEVPE